METRKSDSSESTEITLSGLSPEVLEVLTNEITAYCEKKAEDSTILDDGCEVLALALGTTLDSLKQHEIIENRVIQHAILLDSKTLPKDINVDGNASFTINKTQICFSFRSLAVEQIYEIEHLFNKHYPEVNCGVGLITTLDEIALVFDRIPFFKNILPNIAACKKPVKEPTPEKSTPSTAPVTGSESTSATEEQKTEAKEDEQFHQITLTEEERKVQRENFVKLIKFRLFMRGMFSESKEPSPPSPRMGPSS